MKKLIVLVVFAILSLPVGGCNQNSHLSRKWAGHSTPAWIITDYDTGVQYITSNYGGIYPRLDANGKIVVIKLKEIKNGH